MSKHKPFNRHFTVLGGNVMTSGGSLNLAKGQFGLFDVEEPTQDGLKAVSSLAGVAKHREFQMKVGTANAPLGRGKSNKANSTHAFSLSDVLGVRVSVPSSTEQKLDEVVVGYDGVNANTAITFTKHDRKTIYIRLSGEWLGMIGYPENFVTVEYTMQDEPCSPTEDCAPACDSCETVECAPIILRAIEFLRSYELRGGVKLEDAVEILPIKSCETEPAYVDTDYSFYTVEVTDLGDQNALAMVQAQYPTYKILRTDYKGTTSTYQLITTAAAVITDYSTSLSSILKDCEDCPVGYTASDTGILYAITIEDEGVDVTTTVDNVAGFVTGTVIKQGQNGGIGFYTVITDNEMTAGEITTFVTANKTATVTKVGVVSEFCDNATTTDYSWVEGDSCTVSEEEYNILLPDDECGETRLTELQAYYPELSIIVSQRNTVNSRRRITLTGTSGTATIVVGGVSALATFAVSLTTTAANWVTANAAAVLADSGAVVTAANGIITVVDATTGFPTVSITNASGDLAGTLGAVTVITENVAGGCFTQYETTVVTNMTCEECDPIYKDFYVSVAPVGYDQVKWVKVDATPAYADCLCGIKIKGRETVILADEVLRDSVGFIDSSTQIEVSGGYITEMREGLGQIVDTPFSVKYLSRWEPRTHMGGNLWEFEEESRYFFTGQQRHESYLTRALLGEFSNMEAGKQYIDYTVLLKNRNYSDADFDNIHILVEVGLQSGVEGILNKLAAAAGVEGVRA